MSTVYLILFSFFFSFYPLVWWVWRRPSLRWVTLWWRTLPMPLLFTASLLSKLIVLYSFGFTCLVPNALCRVPFVAKFINVSFSDSFFIIPFLLQHSLGAWMGSITATGSVIAYGKLSGHMSSSALALPGRDYINMGLVRVVYFVSVILLLRVFCFLFQFGSMLALFDINSS